MSSRFGTVSSRFSAAGMMEESPCEFVRVVSLLSWCISWEQLGLFCTTWDLWWKNQFVNKISTIVKWIISSQLWGIFSQMRHLQNIGIQCVQNWWHFKLVNLARAVNGWWMVSTVCNGHQIDELSISCLQARPHGENQPCFMYVLRGGHFISYFPHYAFFCLLILSII